MQPIAWEQPAGHPELLEGEVHLWLADIDRPDLVRAAQEILSPAEVARGSRYRFERDQVWFFARHFFLRILLSRYLHQPASTFDFQLSSFGKPFLAGLPVHFNISDSGGWCLLAFTSLAPLGVDLELIRERGDLMGVARRFFSVAEQAELAALPSDRQLEGFYHIWTQKEAFIKASGEGLSLPLDSFDVVADPGLPGGIRSVRGSGPTSWWMRTFVPRENFRAAVCMEAQTSVQIRMFRQES